MNDIALLRTANQIVFTASVSPIVLGTSVGASATIYGWGRTTAGGNLSATLLRHSFTIVAHATCHARFPFVARKFITSDGHICTSNANAATCPGRRNFQ